MSIEKNTETQIEIKTDYQKNKEHQAINLLEQAFYQPEKNTQQEEPQMPWSIIAAQEKLDTLNKEHQALIDEFGTEDSRGNVAAIATFGLFMLSAVCFVLVTTWRYNAGSALSDKIMFCIMFGLMGVFGGVFIGAGAGMLVQKIYFQIWKRGGEAKALFMRRARKHNEIVTLQKDICQRSSEQMNETYYFESLLKFDHMVERINKAYPEDFLQSVFLKAYIDFQDKRDQITQSYLRDDAQALCKQIEETQHYEKRIAGVWEKYKKTDKNMLEQRYQEFAKNKTPEMLNVL